MPECRFLSADESCVVRERQGCRNLLTLVDFYELC